MLHQLNIANNVLLDQQMTILVVDDEEPNRRLLNRIVGNYGTVIDAPDGQTALDILEQDEVDLVLLDIMMSGMHGLEVLAEIRETYSSNELPVILVSALDDTDDVVNGLQAGANDYIAKPIDVSLVDARVTTHLQLKSVYDRERKATENLRQADALKTKLLSIASHDLKSPLANVSMAEVLLRQLIETDDPTITRILDTLQSTVTNMNNLIVEFLDMAQIQGGLIDTEIEEVNLNALIHEVINGQALYAQEKGSVVIPQTTSATVCADPKRLTQILNNLVSNALKYSPPNSEIHVTVTDEDTTCTINVIDEGPGIPANERDKLFTEFGKLSPRPTGNESSTGLGLWIAKQMVEAMDGDIGVYCPDDGGSIFWVQLPIAC